MYGLPGNVGSKRLNRNATETRVHTLWNHLIETGSHSTGSLLIWDTGEYAVLPHQPVEDLSDKDQTSDSEVAPSEGKEASLAEAEKLHAAFQNRKIRLRLHGTSLPPNYTIYLRLSHTNDRKVQPKEPNRKRRRKYVDGIRTREKTPLPSDGDNDETGSTETDELVPEVHVPPNQERSTIEREIDEREDEKVRQNNAYPGASNTIGSIHQRTWYLSMDRHNSGFAPYRNEEGRRVWKRRVEDGQLLGFEPFFVRGREMERSVVTGRRADEVLQDEGVEGYVGRKGWRAVSE